MNYKINLEIPKKLQFILDPYRYKIAHGGRCSAKCLGLGTPILMYDGSIKSVENVNIGEQVMGPDGTPRNVLNTVKGYDALYRVRQTHGMDYVVNRSHILSLKNATLYMDGLNVVDNIMMKDYLHKNEHYRRTYMGYKVDGRLCPLRIDGNGLGEYAGFTLDGDHLFCLADGTVTHNSWSFARGIIYKCLTDKIRVLCAREVQRSIKDSVHALLSDQIILMGAEDFFEVLDTEIRCRNGSNIIFAGLLGHTIASIKSYENIKLCWVEEAQVVSKKSWDILIPTIRADGSEIWVSFNPELESDDTYQRFVVNPPPDAKVVQVNYMDNPWFNQIMEQERQHCKLTMPDDYEMIWEGKCRSSVSGAIYAKEIEQVIKDSRICNVPYDPRLKVQVIFDLGWNDCMSLIFVQKARSELRIIDHIEDHHKTLDWYAAEMKAKHYNYGKIYLPHDGFSKDYKTGLSANELLKMFSFSVEQDPIKMSVENGIKAARMVFSRVVFDKERTGRLIECLKRYRRVLNTQSNEYGAPMHDEHSHSSDCFRYMAINSDKFTNDDERDPIIIRPRTPACPGMGY